jgi:hypothetical protein
MPQAIHYEFIQKCKVPARKAFAWCTDYSPQDMILMQEENATREIKPIAHNVTILVDTFVKKRKSVVKQKLVWLYPDRLTWTSTHVTGPNKHSQFLYEITPQTDKQCCLKFTALFLDYNVKDEEEAEKLGKELKRMDSENWKHLAKQMEKDMKVRQRFNKPRTSVSSGT